MKTVLTVIGCLVLLAGVTLAALPWVVVDVRQVEPEAFHITVPLPLPLARAALLFVDEDEVRVELPELARFLAGAEEMVRLLAEAPDAELLHVTSRDEEVLISKVGDDLEIDVETMDEEVHVRVPLVPARRTAELLRRRSVRRFPICSMLSRESHPASWFTFATSDHEVTVAIR